VDVSSSSPLRPGASLGRATFDLRLSHVREALRLHASGKAAGAEVARRRGVTAAALAALGGADGPDAWLARATGMSSDLLDFLWTAVALEADPLAQSLAGPLARRGASLSLHVSAFGLDETRAQRLAAELEAHRGAGPARFLVPAGEGEVLPSVPFTVPRRVRSFLAGEDAVEPLVERFGQVRPARRARSSTPTRSRPSGCCSRRSRRRRAGSWRSSKARRASGGPRP
jgi:hypothetical protein